jgi:hypothetical protein
MYNIGIANCSVHCRFGPRGVAHYTRAVDGQHFYVEMAAKISCQSVAVVLAHE